MIRIAIVPFKAYGQALKEDPKIAITITLLVIGIISVIAFFPGEKMSALRSLIKEAYHSYTKISVPLTIAVFIMLYSGLCVCSLKYLKQPSAPMDGGRKNPQAQLRSEQDAHFSNPYHEPTTQSPHARVKGQTILEAHSIATLPEFPTTPCVELLEQFTKAPYAFYDRMLNGEHEPWPIDTIVDVPRGFRAMFDSVAQVPSGKLGIYLCPCNHAPRELRGQLEEESIQLLKNSHPPEKQKKPITITSIGPGGAFQEIVYVAKLMQEGYKKINLVLIDPKEPNIQGLEQIFTILFGPNRVAIRYYQSRQMYVEKTAKHFKNLCDRQVDLLLLIDLDDYPVLAGASFKKFNEENLFKENALVALTDRGKGKVCRVQNLRNFDFDFFQNVGARA